MSDSLDARVDSQINIEQLIQRGAEGVPEARAALRGFLFLHTSEPGVSGSIGDALAALSRQGRKDAVAVVMVLRCLAVHDLLPQPNATNGIARYTVELCESTVPEIVSFLGIDKKSQTFEKFAKLELCHLRAVEILSPIRENYGDLEAVLSSRKEVLGSLNHGFIRTYCGHFKLNEVRSTIEVIFGRLKKVAALETSLLVDIEECNRAIEAAKDDFREMETFLTFEFLRPFLDNCQKVLDNFFRMQRARFETKIVWDRHTNELQKRYPLLDKDRSVQLVVPLKNIGPGLATDVTISVTSESDSVLLGGETAMLGNVLPGDFSFTTDAIVIEPCDRFSAIIQVDWGEIGSGQRKSELFEFRVLAQRGEVDWKTQEFTAPYSTEVAKGDNFYGRDDMVKQLAARLLRDPMESFFITGQKRVGKTSLALASAKYAASKSARFKLNYLYVLWGEIAHSDPAIALQQLGESIAEFITDKLPTGIEKATSQYQGSLAPLIKLSKLAYQVAPLERFVIIIDEFDEMHQELYLHGNLAETFFANLRALSRADNICLVFVGGENMPFVMDRQGQKLNNFARINLNYFSRESEWADFQLLVRGPTNGVLNWHEDAVSEVFNITRGNPYFAKIICAGVFRFAVTGRDSDVTATEVKQATESAISTLGANSFAHLWQDGISKAVGEREPDILRRMRVLVALARCMRRLTPTTASNIADNRSSVELSEAEIPAVLNDFLRRDVLVDRDHEYQLTLPIFQMWLVDVGLSQLIADKLSEELSNSIIAEENAALVKSCEIVELAGTWPTYRGMHVGTDEIRAWLQQVDSPRDQRLLFELLKRTKVLSETFIRERLRAAHAFIRPSLPEFVIRKRGARRFDVLLTYVDGEGKSGASYASMYAEENGIAAECVISRSDFSTRYDNHVSKHGQPAALIITDDIAATGDSLAKNIEVFIAENRTVLNNLIIRVVALTATSSAQHQIDKKLQAFDDLGIEFRCCEVINDANIAFPDGSDGWRTKEERERAKALCTDLGRHIYGGSPLGYGGLGLLIVFPTTVPNNSLPILHSFSRTGSSRSWRPLFPRVVN
ncbi:ATP-binding protein [Agrobacterium vitis]|uniref:phosphoribosyltransferase-like protein n=1 Tax=Allorhizobium ampelinum TaxID=3025782 RepID=UPI001F20C5F4|nr:ATP-binding protein [Allorhizobium ampelinum]MCF1485040.1 ATP-binding protein [Allorhizobium ampelinum]